MNIDIDINILSFRLYIISTIIYIISIYLNINFISSIPIILYLIYRLTNLNIPHFDIIIILYGLCLSLYLPYLFIPFAISILILFIYSCKDIDY